VNILAGDIGGTKTRLALFKVENGSPQTLAQHSYVSADYPSLDVLVHHFQSQLRQPPERACFGLAGPVINQSCSTTNLPWQIEARELERILDVPVWLINDLEATAWGIPCLEQEEVLTLQHGNPDPQANACIIAAGTGLGEAGLYWDGTRLQPFATEGGHTDFAPGNALEFALFEHLSKGLDHVSWERIISGPGLVNIYRFLLAYRQLDEPAWLEAAGGEGGAAAMVSAAALEGRCPQCSEALDLFVSLYGREAGNLALKQMASGGVYIGGGIAPKILPRLEKGGFLEAFNAKGRMAPLMQSMPVKVLLNDRTALFGPAAYAAAQPLAKPPQPT
jgi:glucokinase